MGGLYIKGMEMPKDDMKNIMVLADGRVFQFSGYGNPEPLGIAVPVPDHGDLIDRDGLRKLLKVCGIEDNRVYASVAKMPAIIPDDTPVIYYPQVSWYYTTPHLK